MRLGLEDLRQLPACYRSTRLIHRAAFQIDDVFAVHHLLQRSALGNESGAQRLVAVHQRLQRRAQRGNRQRPAQAIGKRHVVRAGVSRQLVDDPQPLLRKGGREGVGLIRQHRGY